MKKKDEDQYVFTLSLIWVNEHLEFIMEKSYTYSYKIEHFMKLII